MSGGVSAGVSAPAVAARPVPVPVPVPAPGPAVPTGPLPVGGPAAPELGEEARAVRLQAAQIGLRAFTAPDFHPGKVRHIVLMRFLPTITDAQRAEVVRRFMALGQVSRRDNGQQVIADIETGVQMSGEGVDQGFGQGFVVTFNSEGDRNYYVGKPVVSDPAYFDPAHEAFKKFAAPYIIGVLVFDYALPAHQAQRTRRAAVMRPGMTQQQG
ncbi:MAG: Dabb family protein [Komagataeibacter hansenii]|nr:Dabb family protein [Novacetimonas hansenii]